MRGHRQALKKVFGGSGCSRGQGDASSRRRNTVQRPATRHHSRGRATRHQKAAGVHVVGTVFNDQPARMIPGPADATPLAGRAADARSFTRLQRHPPASDSTPRVPPTTPEPDTPAHVSTDRTTRTSPPAPSIMKLTPTNRTPNTANFMVDPEPGRADPGGLTQAGLTRGGLARAGLARAGLAGCGARRQPGSPARPPARSCSSSPLGVSFARFAGHQSARSREVPGRVRRSWSCGASLTARTGHVPAPQLQDRRQRRRPGTTPVTR